MDRDQAVMDYHVHYYGQDYFTVLIDVGASIGQIATPVLANHRGVEAHCFEPCIENFHKLETLMERKNVQVYNLCLGDGKPLYFHKQKKCTHYFTSEKGTDEDVYEVPSMTLPEIFYTCGVRLDTNQRVLLSLDTEGGERFLLDDTMSEEMIRLCDHVAIEVHYPNPSRKYTHFNDFPSLVAYRDWIYGRFEKTHYICFNNLCPTSGLGIYVLCRKGQDVFKRVLPPMPSS